VKPISEWTDDELRALIDHPGRSTWPRDFPDEVLRLRQVESRLRSNLEDCARRNRDWARAYGKELDAREAAEAELAELRQWKALADKWAIDPAGAVQRAEKAEADLAAARAKARELRTFAEEVEEVRDELRLELAAARAEIEHQKAVTEAKQRDLDDERQHNAHMVSELSSVQANRELQATIILETDDKLRAARRELARALRVVEAAKAYRALKNTNRWESFCASLADYENGADQ
jgi:chromosome segregation ATPase